MNEREKELRAATLRFAKVAESEDETVLLIDELVGLLYEVTNDRQALALKLKGIRLGRGGVNAMNAAAKVVWNDHTSNALAEALLDLEQEVEAERSEEAAKPGVTYTSSWEPKWEALAKIKAALGLA